MTNITEIVEVKIMMITPETNKLTHTVTNMLNKKKYITAMEKTKSVMIIRMARTQVTST